MISKILFKKSHIKYFFPILSIIFFVSCATKPRTQRFKIDKEEAMAIIKDSVGTEKPNINIYHTYEEVWQSDYWNNRNGSSSRTYVSKLTFSKIEGNYVEGRMTRMRDGDLEGTYNVSGHFNDTHLFLYQDGGTMKYWGAITEYLYDVSMPNVTKFEITDESRVLKEKETLRFKWGYTIDNTQYRWRDQQPFNKDLYPHKNISEVLKTTDFVSNTDDFLGEKKKSNTTAPAVSQTLTERLKELKDLYDHKLITKEEYDALRKKAMN